MADNTQAWLKRADEILSKTRWTDPISVGEIIQFATSMLTALYGPPSMQLKSFLDGQEAIAKMKGTNIRFDQAHHAMGAIKNAKAELETGLTTNLRVIITGEVLADLLSLGKDTLTDHTDAAKNVAAVLVAAAFEDLIRKMGTEFACVTGRPKLEEIIIGLKNADVLKGGQIGTAQSYLKFRNDSLHADWDKVDRSQVTSCIAFVESLLVKHFS